MNPFDLPVHPIVVHFPIAMLAAAWVCLLCRYGLRAERWDGPAATFETIGVATLPVTILAGFIDTRGFAFVSQPRWDQPLIWHMAIALVSTALFATHWLWRRGRRPTSTAAATADLGWFTLGLAALTLTGAIAGEMVYAT